MPYSGIFKHGYIHYLVFENLVCKHYKSRLLYYAYDF